MKNNGLKCPRCGSSDIVEKQPFDNTVECEICEHKDNIQFFKDQFTKDSLSQNKPIPGAISPSFTDQMSKVLAFGAAKYGRDNWSKCSKEQMFLYEDALLRHITSYRLGEENDEETNLNHLAHAACNLMFIFELNKKEK